MTHFSLSLQDSKLKNKASEVLAAPEEASPLSVRVYSNKQSPSQFIKGDQLPAESCDLHLRPYYAQHPPLYSSV